jgi:hypothetical protein
VQDQCERCGGNSAGDHRSPLHRDRRPLEDGGRASIWNGGCASIWKCHGVYPFLNRSAQAQERKDRHDDDDQADQIN